MPESPTGSVEFASCASKYEAFEAVCCVVCGATALMHPQGWMVSLPLFAGAIWLSVKCYRDWGRPYVAVHDDCLTVHAGSRVLQQVDLHRLVGVRRGWNKTTLQLRDGAAVAVDHGWFSSGAEAERFRKFVEEVNGATKA